MTAKLDEALDALWRTAPEARLRVASEVLASLDRADIDLLTAWDCRASLDSPQRGTLVEITNRGGPHAIVYTDAPWARDLDQGGEPKVRSVASLLYVAHYARDLSDSDLFTYPAERDERIRKLSAEAGIEVDVVVRLLATFSRDVRNMA